MPCVSRIKKTYPHCTGLLNKESFSYKTYIILLQHILNVMLTCFTLGCFLFNMQVNSMNQCVLISILLLIIIILIIIIIDDWNDWYFFLNCHICPYLMNVCFDIYGFVKNLLISFLKTSLTLNLTLSNVFL